jgi:hypothetical protein
VDDIGLLPVSTDAAEGLYRVVDAAYERRSVATTFRKSPILSSVYSHRPPESAKVHRKVIGSNTTVKGRNQLA